MYVLAIIRYRRQFDQVAPHVEAHRAFQWDLKERGLLIAAGPFDPRSGGALLLRLPDEDPHGTLDSIRDDDPYVKHSVAQYEMLPWDPVIGRPDLDRL